MLLQGDLVTVQVAASWCRLVLFGVVWCRLV